MTLLRSGMAAWLQALMAQPQAGEPAPAQRTGPIAAAERERVLCLAALVLGRTEQREVRHG